MAEATKETVSTISMLNDFSKLDLKGAYSCAGYLSWQFDQTVELIKGKVMVKSPAPMAIHQSISSKLSGGHSTISKINPAELMRPPLDVRLQPGQIHRVNQGNNSVVQSDLRVISDKAKIDGREGLGAPNWIK